MLLGGRGLRQSLQGKQHWGLRTYLLGFRADVSSREGVAAVTARKAALGLGR